MKGNQTLGGNPRICKFLGICIVCTILASGNARADDSGVPVVELNQAPVQQTVEQETPQVAPKIYSATEWNPFKLAHSISVRYNVPEAKAAEYVRMAKNHEGREFPKTKDILAVIGIESSFRERARSSSSSGLMQINYEAHRNEVRRYRMLFSPDFNISIGAKTLELYYYMLGKNKRAAIQAYNLGIQTYISGRRCPQYLSRYMREVSYYMSE